MASDITNLDIGACSITLDGVDLGHTMGGVSVSVSRDIVELFADQYAGPVNLASTYENIEVTFNFAETDLVKLKELFPLTKTSATATAVSFGGEAGTLYRSLAAQLILHPYNREVVDKEADLVIEKAVAHGDFSYEYTKDNQKVYSVTMTGLIDATTGLLAYFGASPV